jgi:alpha 1,2-mannosyltransferase
MIHNVRLRPPTLRVAITLALCLFLSLAFLDRQYNSVASDPASARNQQGIGRYPISIVDPLQSPELIAFWKDFQKTLLHAKPQAATVRPNGDAPADELHVDMEKAKTHPRYDNTPVSTEDLEALKQSHKRVVEDIRDIASQLPYDLGTRGIVMTAGGSYFGVAVTSIRMLRRTGSQLPVEVFVDNWAEYDMMTCERILPSLNAKCRVLTEIWSTAPSLTTLIKYQYKAFALLFSSFEEVLFLDADAFPAHNPDELFDVEPYRSNGLVTWPDFWASTASHHFYDIAEIPVPPLNARRSSESGILLWSKKLHADTLLLSNYYNYYGPKYYYPLLSQGAQGQGDKETFLHAALALGNPFYDVRSPVTVMGHWVNGTWKSAGMKQGDPVEDYAVQHKLSTGSIAKPSPAKHGENTAKSTDGETEVETVRPLFIHNNIIKLDPKHLFDTSSEWRNETGHLVRFWGEKDSAIDQFGFDIERVLWEELVHASCSLGGDGCEKTREFFRAVFPDEP